jgi:hypothetical protein
MPRDRAREDVRHRPADIGRLGDERDAPAILAVDTQPTAV